MKIKRLAILAVGLVALLSVASASGAVGSYTTGFESPDFTLGTVNGQDGWHSAAGQPTPSVPALPNGYDQAVVDNTLFGSPSGFDGQSLRMSNAYTNGEFFYQTYSKPTTDPAGENTGNSVFYAKFEFTSTSADQQPGLALSVSPDSNEGSRMQYVRLEDQADGIHVFIDDAILDSSQSEGYDFRETDATPAIGPLSRTSTHTIAWLIQLVAGPNNDIVRVFIDGTDIGDKLGVCFTTWENYYRLSSEQALPNPNDNTPPNLNSLQFRSAGTAVLANLGGGYLYDNVSIETRDSGGPDPTFCGLSGGQIAPTGTTCQAYDDGTAGTLEKVQYTLTKGDNPKINSVSPGVFFFYGTLSGAEGEQFTITQSDNGSTPFIPVQHGQVILYDEDCNVLKWTPESIANGVVSGELPSTGTFIISVKYSASALKGEDDPGTVIYTIDGTSVTLAKKQT